MARKSKESGRIKFTNNPSKQTTSIGKSKNSRPKNKQKRRMTKKYRGQGKG